MTYQIPPNIELGEVKLKVSNLQRSVKFYQEVVGLKLLTPEMPDLPGDPLETADTLDILNPTARLTVDGKQALVVLEEIPNAKIVQPRSATGLYHFAILVPNREALGLSLRNLIESGIRIGQADHLVSEALYISDPDHNGIEIYVDRPRESWSMDAEGYYTMASDPLDWDGLLQEAEGKSWTGLPLGTIIGHVHFHVGELELAKEFYCDLLGFEIKLDARRQMGALFISAGGYHHHVGLNIWAGVGAPVPPENGTGLKYYTILMPNHAEWDKIVNRLKNAGISVKSGTSTAEQDRYYDAEDPFGIKLRLTYK
ncbi:MAG TPA: VOC family protein [Bacilli bacterium]